MKTLPFYNNYFGIAYPLPKVDLIAIPDFSAGRLRRDEKKAEDTYHADDRNSFYCLISFFIVFESFC